MTFGCSRVSLRLLLLIFFFLFLLVVTRGVPIKALQLVPMTHIAPPSKTQGSNPLESFCQLLKKAGSKAFHGGLYGAAAGSIQVLVLMWLRTVVNFQYRYGVGFVQAVKTLYLEGGVYRFYRGLPYALLQNPLSKFGSVAANEASRVIVGNRPFIASALGIVLTTLWRILIMPLETIKTILQVNGSKGFERMSSSLRQGHFSVLYAGTSASILSTFISHYPWYLIHNILESLLEVPSEFEFVVIRSAIIGLVATAVSDVISNTIRVIKTLKQSLAIDSVADASYEHLLWEVYDKGGLLELATRGLPTRLLANAIQGVLFTVLWKILPIYFKRRKDLKTSLPPRSTMR